MSAVAAGQAGLPDHPGSGPFKFLDYYTREDCAAFGGREREVRELQGLVLSNRTLVLYGRSGLGKTSLLLAGLLPALPADKFQPVYVRVLTDPLGDLRAAIARTGGIDDDGRTSLVELIRCAAPNRIALLILDQFEEFFVHFRGARAAREAFVREIAAVLSDQTLDVRAIFSLREDYLAELDEFRAALPDLLDNQYRLQPLTAFGARRAIAQPLEHAGVRYEPALLVRLVDMLEKFNFDPAVMQIVCTEVYRGAAVRARGAPAQLLSTDLDDVGGVDGIFRKYIENATKAIAPEDKLFARMLLDALITQERTKRAATLSALMAAHLSVDRARLQNVADILYRCRIVRRENRTGEDWYELLHERLIEHIERWLDGDDDFRRFRSARDLIALGTRVGGWRKNPSLLLNAGQIKDLIDDFIHHLRLDSDQLEYVVRSVFFASGVTTRLWAEKLGMARSRALLAEWLSTDNDELRRSAVIAAAALDDEDGHFARRSLELALSHPHEPLRRIAGRTFAKLSRQDDFGHLLGALRQRAQSRQAHAVLADLAAERPDLLQHAGWFARRRARNEAQRRRMLDEAAEVEKRRSRGTRIGALGALLWTLTGGFFLGVIESFTYGFAWSWSTRLSYLAIVACVLVPGSIGLGAWAGRRASYAAVRRKALNGAPSNWGALMLRLWSVWLPLMVLPALCGLYLVALSALTEDAESAGFASGVMLSIVVFFAALMACTALYLHFVQSAQGNWTQAAAWRLLVVAGFGWPLLLPLLGLQVAADTESVGAWQLPAADVFCFLFGVLSTGAAFGLTATARGAVDPQRGEHLASLASRLVLGLGPIATVFYLLLAYGLPTRDVPEEISADKREATIVLPLARGPYAATTRSFRVTGAGNHPVRFERLDGSAGIEMEGHTIFFPRHETTEFASREATEATTAIRVLPEGTFELVAGKGPAETNRIKVSLLPVLPDTGDVPWQKSAFVAVPLKLTRDPDTSKGQHAILSGSLHGRWPGEHKALGVQLAFGFPESREILLDFGGKAYGSAILTVTSTPTNHATQGRTVDLSALIPSLKGHPLQRPATVSVLRGNDTSGRWDVQVSIDIRKIDIPDNADGAVLLVQVEGLGAGNEEAHPESALLD